MTALTVFRHSDAVHIVSDGTMQGMSGAAIGSVSKVWPIPHLSAAVAMRGGPIMLPVMSFALQTAATFDDLRNEVAALARRVFDEWRVVLEQSPFSADFDLAVAGISERDGPASYLVCNHNRYGVKPWTVVDLGPCALLPGGPAVMDEFWKAYPAGTSSQALDPERDGLRILEMQQRHELEAAFEMVDGTPLPMRIGGFAQLTTVRRDAITTKIIHRWPDEAGNRYANVSDFNNPGACTLKLEFAHVS